MRERESGLSASIDELLGYEEPSRPRPHSERRWWLRTLLLALAITVGLLLLGRLYQVAVPFIVVYATVVALFALQRIVAGVMPAPTVDPGPRRYRPGMPSDTGAPVPTPDAAVVASSRWDTRLRWTQSDPDRFASLVQPALAALADERLRQRHGFTMAGDPARARALLGDPLWTFLTTRVTRTVAPAQLVALVERLEAI